MKTLKTLTLVFFLLLTSVLTSAAQTTISPEKRELIAELITLLKVDRQMVNAMDLMFKLQETSYQSSLKSMLEKSPEFSETDKAELLKVLASKQANFTAKFRERFQKEINLKDYIEETVYPLYGNFFEEAELRDMVGFYKSLTGQKMINKTPQLMAESFRLTEEKFLPRIEKIVNEILQEEIKSIQQQPVKPN